jgi:hypothetical protein
MSDNSIISAQLRPFTFSASSSHPTPSNSSIPSKELHHEHDDDPPAVIIRFSKTRENRGGKKKIARFFGPSGGESDTYTLPGHALESSGSEVVKLPSAGSGSVTGAEQESESEALGSRSRPPSAWSQQGRGAPRTGSAKATGSVSARETE